MFATIMLVLLTSLVLKIVKSILVEATWRTQLEIFAQDQNALDLQTRRIQSKIQRIALPAA